MTDTNNKRAWAYEVIETEFDGDGIANYGEPEGVYESVEVTDEDELWLRR